MQTTVGASAWLRRFHSVPDAEHRVVCFPHAGGSASFYFPFSKALSADADVLAVQYPGRQDRRHEPCVNSVTELADILAEELRPWLDRPVTFFGHSMGGSVAFEVATRLQARGMTVHTLVVSGRRAPSRVRDEQVHLRDDEGLLDHIVQLGGTDRQVLSDPELLRMVLPMVRSDYRAAETYRHSPGPKLTCPVLALTGDTDPQVTHEEAAAWGEHTTGPFALEVFSGSHFYLLQHITGVSAAVASRLG
ncbi:thioesterase II family protein [Streptomyces sp. NPDC001480]|uniref:thioesterase II family protein n=1 Tax=Streptomyces sp. NPDC001480 TaxID=3364577 RepID=UPI00368E7662